LKDEVAKLKQQALKAEEDIAKERSNA